MSRDVTPGHFILIHWPAWTAERIMPRMTTKPTTIAAYFASLTPETREILTDVQSAIHQVIPDGEDVISYDIPTIKVDGKPVIYYSAWSDHIAIYPLPRDEKLAEEIGPFVHGKGTLRFDLGKPIPLPLIKHVAQALLAERGKNG